MRASETCKLGGIVPNKNKYNKRSFCSIEQAYKLAGLPSINSWKGLSCEELDYRKYMLQQIANRVSKDGIRTCKTNASRAKQFMPYAALTGYESVVENVASKNENCKQ